MIDIKENNIIALKKKSELLEKKIISRNISNLSNLPSFFDWVKCYPSKNVYFNMFLGGKDDGVAARFFWEEEYEYLTLKIWYLLAKNTQENSYIIDVGAHTGSYSLTAYLANVNSVVISIEPHVFNVARLMLNLKANNFKTTNIVNGAISNKNEISTFSIKTKLDYLSSGGSLGKKDNALTTNVMSYTLDQLIPLQSHKNVSLIKIDTEGHEPECLEGSKNILSLSMPTIFFECNNFNTAHKVEKFLRDLNYIFFEIDDNFRKISLVSKLEVYLDSENRPIQNKINRIAVHKSNLDIFEKIALNHHDS